MDKNRENQYFNAYLANDWEGLKRMAEEDLRKDPQNVEILSYLCEVYNRLNDTAACIGCCERTIRLAGNRPLTTRLAHSNTICHSYIYLGNAYVEDRRFDQAKQITIRIVNELGYIPSEYVMTAISSVYETDGYTAALNFEERTESSWKQPHAEDATLPGDNAEHTGYFRLKYQVARISLKEIEKNCFFNPNLTLPDGPTELLKHLAAVAVHGGEALRSIIAIGQDPGADMLDAYEFLLRRLGGRMLDLSSDGKDNDCEALAFKCITLLLEMDRADSTAYQLMGKLYYRGNTVEKDEKKAFEFFRKAVELEHGETDVGGSNNTLIAICYYDGIGTPVNYELAYRHAEEAARGGDAVAERITGLCLSLGRGTSRNSMLGMQYLSRAKEHGDEMAANILDDGDFFANMADDLSNPNSVSYAATTTAVTCPRCGTRNPAGTVFCENCGCMMKSEARGTGGTAPQGSITVTGSVSGNSTKDTGNTAVIEETSSTESSEKICPKCNTLNLGEAVFCSNCGTLLNAPQSGGWNSNGNAKSGIPTNIKYAIIAAGAVLVAVIIVLAVAMNKDGTTENDDYTDDYDENYYSESYDEDDSEYDADLFEQYGGDFIFPDSDRRYLSDSDVEYLSEDDLQMAINEIYARHGRIFEEEPYSSYFNSCEWYDPIYSADEFDDAWFNDYERRNIDLLSKYRNYYEE